MAAVFSVAQAEFEIGENGAMVTVTHKASSDRDTLQTPALFLLDHIDSDIAIGPTAVKLEAISWIPLPFRVIDCLHTKHVRAGLVKSCGGSHCPIRYIQS